MVILMLLLDIDVSNCWLCKTVYLSTYAPSDFQNGQSVLLPAILS